MTERVDIVDENDNVIGQEFKIKCHAESIRHRGSAVFVFRDNSFKETLIQKRSMTVTIKPRKFCIPAGHLIAGEDYLAGGKRELQEELFHEKELPKEIKFEKLFKIKKSTDSDPEFNTVYRVVYPGPFFNDPKEVESYSFENIGEILKNIKINPKIFTETSVLLLKEYEKRFL